LAYASTPCSLKILCDLSKSNNALDEMATTNFVGSGTKNTHDTQLRIAFDGDAVLFSDEAEKIFQEKGLGLAVFMLVIKEDISTKFFEESAFIKPI
jgi:hypothetical protein